ncbi:hypothetical protein Bca52824_031052 [Brassica carinata]|uniref:Uncharacterized protein n=1 Tax=Brassica carinata TaxID=52824 RepID=A0A8X7V684_BRACI|nr:hypothetical protein Bca52824_031052 [Brassica carinata]
MRKRKWMEVKPLAGNDDLMDMADEDVMMLLPQFFAPKDMSDNLVLKLPGTSGPKKKDEAPTQNLCEAAEDDDEISLSSHGYREMENNNSRTYLQGLFDRFPSSKPALDGADSDGEYQIYEQESNALDDDDDDDDGDDDDDDDDDE